MVNIVNKIFPKKTSSARRKNNPGQPQVASEGPGNFGNGLTPSQPTVTNQPVIRLETPQLLVGFAQSKGIRRDTNEDSLFTLTSNLDTNGLTMNFGLYMIADGMGGHEGGEIASRIAVEKTSSYVIDKLYLPSISTNNHQLDNSIQEVLHEGTLRAHQAIRHSAPGSGTTLTAALVLGDQLTIAHIGDSRAYLIEPDQRMQLLTHDHSMVKRLEEIGQLTTDEASRHPKRNLLYKALGQGDQAEPDVSTFHIFPGQILLICTDGLWGVVSETEIIRIIESSNEPQNSSQLLIDAANSAGGPDNISVILVRFPG